MEKCVLVVGMHRSGTSAVAGAMDRLGVDFGSNMIDTLPENPKGFYENRSINHLDIEILSFLGMEWYQVGPFCRDHSKASLETEFGNRIEVILDEEYATSRVTGIKEPRMSLFLPLYFDILKNKNVEHKVVVVNRSNIEVALSLRKRNNLSLIHGILLSQFYKYHIRKFTSGERIFAISFNEFLNNPISTLRKINEFHGLALELTREKEAEVTDFLDTALRHNQMNKSIWFAMRVILLEGVCYLLLAFSLVFKTVFFRKPVQARNL